MPLGSLGGYYNHLYCDSKLDLQRSTAMEFAPLDCSLLQKGPLLPHVRLADSHILELFPSHDRTRIRAFGLDTSKNLC